MSKHTPGPWKIHKQSVKMAITGKVHQVTDNDRYPAAFVPSWEPALPNEVDGAEEALANAHLIAAAPDLLEALKGLVDACVNDFTLNGDDDEPVGGGLNADGSVDAMAMTFGHIRRAAAAIAKAEGRS